MTRFFRRPTRQASARLALSTIAALVAILALAVPVLACDIRVQFSSPSGAVGESATVTVSVYQTHRTCELSIEDARITLSGLTLVSETPWTEVSSMGYEKQLTVELVAPGEGRVEVVRVCSKGGDSAAASILIESAVLPEEPADEPSDTGPAADATSVPVQEEEAVVPAPAPAAPEPAWTESLWRSLRQPQFVVLVVLVAAGVALVAKGVRKARPFVLLVSLGYLGFYIGGCPCPIGSLQNVIIYAGSISSHITPYVQLGVVVLATLLFGRIFCGWACPLGATQYFLSLVTRGKGRRSVDVPPEEHRILRWAKYGVLVVLIVLVIVTGQPVFEDIDPFRALFNLDFRWGVPLVFLIVVIAASVIIRFPFCKYFCPLGALLGLLQPLAVFKLRFNGSCTSCGLCSRTACDYGAIEQGSSGAVIDQRECVRCGECLSRCPRGSVAFTAKRD